ncbi:MAG TPA: hypothetical protein VEB43_17855 [Anaeromyxobacter sp.]|nr:hypothetical protein [Anaeromyxobacter sp.]
MRYGPSLVLAVLFAIAPAVSRAEEEPDPAAGAEEAEAPGPEEAEATPAEPAPPEPPEPPEHVEAVPEGPPQDDGVAVPAEPVPPPAPAPAPAAPPTVAPAPAPGPVDPRGRRWFRLDPRRLVPHYEFLEDSYLDYFVPSVGPARDERLFFEGQAASHLFLWNQWAKVQEPNTPRWLFVNNLGVTFILHVRMVQEPSAPVRPPSYIPRIDYQLFALRRTRADLVDILELRLTPWGHHSNGQTDCAFAEGVDGGGPAPGECIIPEPDDPPTDRVNFRTGDFSTSFFIVGAHYARIGLDRDRWQKWRVAIGGLFEGHPRPWGPGTITRTDARLYGQWRAKLEAELRYRFVRPLGIPFLTGMASLTGSGEVMWHVAPGIPWHREIVELAYQPDGFRGAGLFVRYFSGQDTLNVLYAAGRTELVAFGIIWSGSPQVQYTFGGVP